MVTSLYAGILALIYVVLSIYVVMGRYKHRVIFGDDGNPDMVKRVRIHGNFVEYVPLTLLLLLMYEMQAGSIYMIHALGIAFVIGRLLHIFALKTGFFPARGIGMVLTFAVIAILAVILVSKGITAIQVL